MRIDILTEVTDSTVSTFNRLMSQLVSDHKDLNKEYLAEVINASGTKVFVAREEDIIVGCLILVSYKLPTGIKTWIEDVVTDISVRGKGVGEKLVRYAVECARKEGITKIDLTSRPERIAANRLYQKIGFQQRETNIYRLIV